MSVSEHAKNSYEEYDAVRDVVLRYFDGWFYADESLLRSVFHESCHLKCVMEDAIDIDDMEKVYASIRQRVSPYTKNEVRNDRILSLLILAPTLAVAQVELSIGKKLFLDCLSFLKIAGEWKIVSKVYASRLIA